MCNELHDVKYSYSHNHNHLVHLTIASVVVVTNKLALLANYRHIYARTNGTTEPHYHTPRGGGLRATFAEW